MSIWLWSQEELIWFQFTTDSIYMFLDWATFTKIYSKNPLYYCQTFSKAFYAIATNNASHLWLALKGKLFVRFKCQISKKAQAKKREQQCGGGSAACCGGGLDLAVQLELATQSLAAQKMQFNYVNSWADENSANRKARKKKPCGAITVV